MGLVLTSRRQPVGQCAVTGAAHVTLSVGRAGAAGGGVPLLEDDGVAGDVVAGGVDDKVAGLESVLQLQFETIPVPLMKLRGGVAVAPELSHFTRRRNWISAN